MTELKLILGDIQRSKQPHGGVVRCCVRGCDIVEGANGKCELHHALPKFMGGDDKDGRMYLCLKHHALLHSLMADTVYKTLKTEELREAAREAVARQTLRMIQRGF